MTEFSNFHSSGVHANLGGKMIDAGANAFLTMIDVELTKGFRSCSTASDLAAEAETSILELKGLFLIWHQ